MRTLYRQRDLPQANRLISLIVQICNAYYLLAASELRWHVCSVSQFVNVNDRYREPVGCVQVRIGRCRLASRLGVMHLIATNVCMWIQQTVASITASRHAEPADLSVNYNTSQVVGNVNASAAVTPAGLLYTLIHHNVSPSSSSAATQIHLSDIGLIIDYGKHWNATGESPAILYLTSEPT